MKINNDYVLKHALDSDILVNIKNNGNFIIKLNSTSKDIFNYIKDGKAKEEIIDLLSKDYDISKDTLINDVDSFINEMIEKKIFIND